MKRKPIRLMLLTVFLATMGLTAYLFWMAEREVRTAAEQTRAFDAAARTAALNVSELRAAQQAYVAAGQGGDFWFTRTHELQNELKTQIAAMRRQTSSSNAVSAFEGVLGLLQDFEQMDFRAREHVRGREAIAASDLIFGGGLDLTRKAAEMIELGRVQAITALDHEIAALERRELFSLAAAAAAATLIVLLLVPIGASSYTAGEVARVTASAASRDVAPTLTFERTPDLPRVPATEPDEVAAFAEPDPLPVAVPRLVAADPVPTPPIEPPRVDLEGIADLCGDLARLIDTRALPDVLARAATLLDASGIVLWIADPDGRELAPIVSHGYPLQVVNRLGVITRDAENLTAAAFRTSLLQTIRADSVSSGAIAAPLVTPHGCVGVIAAEVRRDGEGNEAVLAAAGILAAQLATLVAPPSSRAAMKVEVG